MVTAYSPILKLALPVQGELSGTWGDVVNDNITSMVEQAIAGRAVIDTWTTDSHTLTTANGTTSESRCAMLELTDTGTALTGAGTVICPTASKIYIVKNAAGQNITVKTVSGTGILVPDGRTTFLFCDGTNVVEALTHTTSLQLGTSTTVTAVLDEDNMASDSATALATQQSIKAYVDAQVGAFDSLAEVLAVGNTTGANDIIVDNGQKITVNTIDETTAAAGVTIDSVLLKDDGVNATNLEVTNLKANDGTAAGSIADSTGVVTVASAVLTTADINGGTADNVVIGGTTPAAATVTTATANTSLNIAGTVTVTSILDEDNMASDDPAGLATQQSIKAYVDAQVGANNELSEVLANGNTTGGTDIAVSTGDDITFADSSKAIFGAGSDLQIYHDGDNSYINDGGIGSLKIRADQLRIESADGSETLAVFNQNSDVFLRHDNTTRLATTSTGIDVTGTVTADMLETVSGVDIDMDSVASGQLKLDGDGYASAIALNAEGMNVYTNSAVRDVILGTNETQRLRVGGNGDITFYDTSGNASFVYDESAGSTFNENGDAKDFQVKSNSNSHMLFVDGTNDRVYLGSNTANVGGDFLFNGITGLYQTAVAAEPQLRFATDQDTGATEWALGNAANSTNFSLKRYNSGWASVLSFDLDGDMYLVNKFGIGESSPAYSLDIKGSSSTTTGIRLKNSDTSVGGGQVLSQIIFENNDDSGGIEGNYYIKNISSDGFAASNLDIRYDRDGTEASRLKFTDASGYLATVFNDANEDVDFRVASDSNVNMLFVDAANDEVGIGTNNPDATMHVYGSLTVGKSGVSENHDLKMWPATAGRSVMGFRNQDNFMSIMSGDPLSTDLVSITTGARMGINNVTSPDAMLQINNSGNNFPTIRTYSTGNAATFETGNGTYTTNANDGYVIVRNQGAGAAIKLISDGETVFNAVGSANNDFRVESDNNTNAFVVDAGTSIVRIGAGSDVANNTQPKLSITTPWKASTNSSYDGTLSLVATGGGASGGRGPQIIFTGEDGTSARTLAKIDAIKENSTSGDHDGGLIFRTRKNASDLLPRLHLLSYAAIFNDDSDDTDFIVESNNKSNMLFVNAAEDTVCIGANSAATSGLSNGAVTAYSGSSQNVFKAVVAASGYTAYSAKPDGHDNWYFGYLTNASGSNIGSIYASASGTTYNTTSDRRLKDNIEPIADGTEKLMAMKPVSHTWIADPEADAVHGFIAQEMQEIVPEAVSGDPDGEEMMAMDYGRITPVLVAALQDAHNKIEALETRLAELEGK